MIKSSIFHEDCNSFFSTLEDNSVDLIITDPPYGVNFQSGRQVVDRKKSVKENISVKCREKYFNPVMNDSVLLTKWVEEAYRVLRDKKAIYIFCHWSKWGDLQKSVTDAGFLVKNMIILNKSNHGSGDLKGSYAPKHELLLFATKGRHKLNFPTGREKDIWDVPVKFSGSHKFHPNEKPLSWIIPAIENSSNRGDLILDPFMGSGSTGIAAISMGRSFCGVEIDKPYFDIANTRIEEAKGKYENSIL